MFFLCSRSRMAASWETKSNPAVFKNRTRLKLSWLLSITSVCFSTQRIGSCTWPESRNPHVYKGVWCSVRRVQRLGREWRVGRNTGKGGGLQQAKKWGRRQLKQSRGETTRWERQEDRDGGGGEGHQGGGETLALSPGWQVTSVLSLRSWWQCGGGVVRSALRRLWSNCFVTLWLLEQEALRPTLPTVPSNHSYFFKNENWFPLEEGKINLGLVKGLLKV